MQEIITYSIVSGALAYLVIRAVRTGRKKSCGGCAGACSSIDFSKIDVKKTFRPD